MRGTQYLYAIFIFGWRERIFPLEGLQRAFMEEIMTWTPIEWARRAHAPEVKLPTSDIPASLRIAGNVLRAVFIICLLAITARVSMPQNETIWTAYDSPGDLVRLALGFAVCLWIVIQFFKAPKDAHAYRTWLYFGLAAVPFAAVCLLAIW
jgi:hypothetical protein